MIMKPARDENGACSAEERVSALAPRLLSIGEFSRRSGISPRMLRFYADRGILVPAHTDARTGYRRYLVSQLMEARLLQGFRDVDFSVRDMAALLNGAVCGDVRRFVEEQKLALRQKMEALRTSLETLENMLCDEPVEPCGLVRTAEAHVLAASFRAPRTRLRTLACEAAKPLLDEVGATYDPCSAPIFCTFENPAPASVASPFATLDATVCVIVNHETGRTLPGGTMAATLHRGPYDHIGESFGRLMDWIESRKLVVTGRIQECYFPFDDEKAPHGRVEVAIPVLEPER